MSMILDALTRAENERQLEKQPDLKFVTPIKPPKNKPNKIWLYVGLGVLANALILFFLIRAFSGSAGNEMEMEMADGAASSAELDHNLGRDLGHNLGKAGIPASPISDAQQQLQPAIKNEQQQQAVAQAPISQAIAAVPIQAEIQNPGDAPTENLAENLVENMVEDRPLAMEANNLQTPEVDRPLFYESKQPNTKPVAPKPKQASALAKPSTSVTKGNVSFSSTELSADDAIPIINKPKLLIDQGNELNNNVATDQINPQVNTRANTQANSGSVPNVRDLPESSRTSLNQYEVNVHVFDDNPTRRFVLINMDKYKEGDRIANNGPLVEEITSEGVVVDYGSGRALLPAK